MVKTFAFVLSCCVYANLLIMIIFPDWMFAAKDAFDSYLLLRGLKTLSVRMEKQQANALKIAGWLKTQPWVKDILYVSLKSHPGYDINCSQSRGYGSMISFHVDSEATAIKILQNVKLITYAESHTEKSAGPAVCSHKRVISSNQ